MGDFGDFKEVGEKFISIMEGEFYPDYLESAVESYSEPISHFQKLLDICKDSKDLLESIAEVSSPERIQLLRVFKKYVSPDTSVEMLKKKSMISRICKEFGHKFRPIEQVKEKFRQRPAPDETLSAVLYEYKDRGQKGYKLTEIFFEWFRERFGDAFVILGPERAGKDIMLNELLSGFPHATPADFALVNKKGKVLVVGFARYDSDRGGSQEDDRVKGNRDNITEILNYAKEKNPGLKIIFLNDGPGLLLGSMWRDYASLEHYGKGKVLVTTLKMLNDRLTKDWILS